MSINYELEFDGVSVTEDIVGKGSRAALKYIARCTAGETEYDVRQGLKSIAPATYQNLVLSSAAVLSMVADNPGDRVYMCEAGYSKAEDSEPPKPTDETTVVLEIRSAGGTTANRMFSQQLIEEVFNDVSYSLTGTSAEKIIGLKAADSDDSNTMNAVGVPFKQNGTQLTVHAWRSLSTVNGGYLAKVSDAAERQVVNAGIYKGFEAGSLQFVDWTGTQSFGTNGGWSFSFVFDYARKVTPSVPGLPAFTTAKKGHEYLDVLFMPQLLPIKKIMLPIPVRAAIHKIFDTENFAQYFGI